MTDKKHNIEKYLTQGTDTQPSPAQDGATQKDALPTEYGGRKGPEATRYGDWEKNGKCVDF